MEVRDSEYLARFRVSGKGNINYRSESMNTEEQNLRRSWMRKHLIGTRFQNCNNDFIDGMRMEIEQDSGGIWIEDIDGYMRYAPGTKIQKEERDFRRMRAMMPPEFFDLKAKDFDWTRYKENVEKEIKTVNKFIMGYEKLRAKGMGVYIYSKTKGSGKTMLSCCILNEISTRYIGSIKFVNALDFLEMTKKGYVQDNPDVDALYMCKTLVIDDIGVQLDREWVNTVFYRLINARYENRKVTIYTSNLPVKDLKMDDRIVSRIESKSFEIHLPEISVRRMIWQEEKDKVMHGL